MGSIIADGVTTPSEPIAGEALTYLWSKKIGQQKVTLDLSKNMLPKFYQTHLQQHLTQTQFLVLSLLLNVLQSSKQVKLEHLARMFPYPITIESRRRKLQRFLKLPQLRLDLLWYPLITYWLTTYCQVGQTFAIVIDRTQ
jgi:urease accessory protein UreF